MSTHCCYAMFRRQKEVAFPPEITSERDLKKLNSNLLKEVKQDLAVFSSIPDASERVPELLASLWLDSYSTRLARHLQSLAKTCSTIESKRRRSNTENLPKGEAETLLVERAGASDPLREEDCMKWVSMQAKQLTAIGEVLTYASDFMGQLHLMAVDVLEFSQLPLLSFRSIVTNSALVDLPACIVDYLSHVIKQEMVLDCKPTASTLTIRTAVVASRDNDKGWVSSGVCSEEKPAVLALSFVNIKKAIERILPLCSLSAINGLLLLCY